MGASQTPEECNYSQRLAKTIEEQLDQWWQCNNIHQSQFTSKDSRYGHSWRYILYILLLSVLLAIGAVDLDNRVSISLVAAPLFLIIFTISVCFLQYRQQKWRRTFSYKKIQEIAEYMKRIGDDLEFSEELEPQSDEVIGHLCIRNGKKLIVPNILLVEGERILIRPGQVIPCNCVLPDGTVLYKGMRHERKILMEPTTATVPLLEPIEAVVLDPPIKEFLRIVLEKEVEPSFLESQIAYLCSFVGEKIVIPSFLLISGISVVIRYFYSDSQSFYGTRFVFSITPLTILPLMCPTLPLVLWMLQKWNCFVITDHLLGVGSFDQSQKDLMTLFAALTGVSVVDKKGILSAANPSLDKVVVFRESPISPLDVVPEVMDLSSEQLPWGRRRLYFDVPYWDEYSAHLKPLALNLQLNSCDYYSRYLSFLDHLSAVSYSVPRTIAIANRRCMCQLAEILGFDEISIKQFTDPSPPQLIGFYKRQPGDAPVPGLIKHRTPLEMAYCSLHTDDRSLHSHVSCQGTSDLVLEASSHVWNGERVVPLSSRLIHTVKDLYHRHSMTSHCLALSYRPTGYRLDLTLEGKCIEVPLTRYTTHSTGHMPRSHSFDGDLHNNFFTHSTLKDSESVLSEIFSGHILCGMTVMQYEALPSAVLLVDSLESNCIRFVYFSRENELRSRIFAEKLGLEAGWNCHISLAEDVTTNEFEQGKLFVDTDLPEEPPETRHKKLLRQKFAKAKSELLLPLSLDDVLKSSPLRRRSSISPEKVGPMPNKAQLPTGIEGVRPHLDNIDNVPLLVGLFTDCRPNTNANMIEIMQDYGEVVLSIGSALNIQNVHTFTTSHISVCISPLREPICSRQETPEHPRRTALHLAATFMSLATDFHLNQNQLMLISELVTCCRHRLSSIRSSLCFFFLSSVQLSLTLLLSTLFDLPLIFTTGQVFLTTFVHLPLLFFGTVWTTYQPKEKVIRIANKKNQENNTGSIYHAGFTFAIVFLPTVAFLLGFFFFALIRNATLLCSFSDVVCSFGDEISGHLNNDDIRHLTALMLIVFICTNSASWVYPLCSFWSQIPVISVPWITASSLCILTQVCYSYLNGFFLHRVISIPSVILMFVWCTVVGVVNELWKWRSIRKFQREQRRTKLAFDTKLGMNSPY